jgi:dihydropteroate synthase
VRLFGVCNASTDSLNEDSIVRNASEARARAEQLLADGVWGFDVGGQGSTFQAEERTPDREWDALADVIDVLVATGRPVSVDSWRPEVVRRALAAGVTWINAADGLQDDEMLEVAAEHGCPVVLPFLTGPDPLHMAVPVSDDPMGLVLDFFEHALARVDRFGIRGNMVLDPGTGFAPHDWPWEQRFEYQKLVYGGLNRLRAFDLPIYIALPWKDTPQHAELLEIILDHDPDYGRAHYPAKVARAEAARRGEPR